MKNPNIKKCILPCTPKTTCTDILTGIWLGIGRPVREHLSRKGLEQWFNGDVMTHLGDYRCGEVSDLIVAYCLYATHMACHRMIDREGSAATTLLRSMTETPSVSQANGISKFPLVEMKTVLFEA